LELENKLWVDTRLPLDPAFKAGLAGLAARAWAANCAALDREQEELSAFLAKINRPREPPRYDSAPRPSLVYHCHTLTCNTTLLFDSAFTETNGLAVINGTWFQGEWENKFTVENTKAAPFHQLGSDDVSKAEDVQMMCHPSASVAHGTFEHHSMVSLPHENSLLRLLVLLPHVNSADGLAAVRTLGLGGRATPRAWCLTEWTRDR
jgi:hypothetical protein